MMNKHLLLALAAGVAFAGVLKADDAAPAATTPAAAAATAAAPAADAKADTFVAKNDAPGSLKAGNQLLDAGKYEEASAYFEGIGEQSEANGKTKREPYRLLGLSTACLNLNKFKEAEDAASKGLDLKKDVAALWNNLASAQANQGERDKAIDTYTKGIAELQADKIDTTKLDANLKALQAAADAGKPKAKKETTADATGSTPDAAAAPVSPAASDAK